MNFVFLTYGVVVLLIDAFGVWKPRAWVEWTERQFIYRRERIGAGAFFVLLGAVPIYWILGLSAWQFYILAALSGFWMLLGFFILVFPDALRNMILALGGLDDKWLRVLFLADSLAGVALILISVFT